MDVDMIFFHLNTALPFPVQNLVQRLRSLIRGGPLGCLLGFWPSGPKPCGGNNQLADSKCEGSTVPLNEFLIGYKYQILWAFLCKPDFMLPTSTILAATWLSVNHLTCDPFNTEANDCKENSITDDSFHVEL